VLTQVWQLCLISTSRDFCSLASHEPGFESHRVFAVKHVHFKYWPSQFKKHDKIVISLSKRRDTCRIICHFQKTWGCLTFSLCILMVKSSNIDFCIDLHSSKSTTRLSFHFQNVTYESLDDIYCSVSNIVILVVSFVITKKNGVLNFFLCVYICTRK
jgi:hypothetical protein